MLNRLPDEAWASRELYRPSPDEITIACETLLRAGIPREARKVVREIYETTENDHVAERA